ncbi:MAG TPA: hypothetical protein VLJ37_11900 [bacterium]|nr:hypothetical protein [bacterium]
MKYPIVAVLFTTCFTIFCGCSSEKVYFKQGISGGSSTIVCKFFHSSDAGFGSESFSNLKRLIGIGEFREDRFFSSANSSSSCDGNIERGCGFIVTALNTESPELIGNMGNSPLLILERNDSEILLVERTLMGGFILNRIDLRSGLIVQTKNIGGLGANYGFVNVGQCSEKM